MLFASVVAIAAVGFSGCGGASWTMEPEEDIFNGNESVSDAVAVTGPAEYKIIGQGISEAEGHFKLESECAGKTLKPKEKEVLSCGFKVTGENFNGGSEAKLTTEVENLSSKTTEIRCAPLMMAGGKDNLSHNVNLRPRDVPAGPGGVCFPFDYGHGGRLAKNSVNLQKFEFKAINGDAEFKIVETAPELNAPFTLVNATNGCTGVVVKNGAPCTFEIKLTTNNVGSAEFETLLKMKYKVIGEETVYERSGLIKGKNAA